MKRIVATLALCFCSCPYASAENVVMSCAVEEAGPNHARRTLEISFDQQNQLAYVSSKVATAAITDARITFRIDLGAGLPFSFDIDRKTGAISVRSDARVLYNGQCKVAGSSTPATR
ncbi:MAG TPA: hypothetical protein VGI65_01165 [Steroidobacteraceae bacterium]